MRHRRCAGAPAAVGLAGLLLWLGACGAPGAEGFEPDIQVVDLEGLKAALAAQRARGLLVNHWAMW